MAIYPTLTTLLIPVVSFLPQSNIMPPNDQQGGSSSRGSPLATTTTTRTNSRSTTPDAGGIAFQPAKAVIFDLDGTLLDTETLSCSAVLDAFGPSLSESTRDRLRREEGYKLPWELKKQTLGLQGHAWIPLVLEYGRQNWGVRLAADHDGNDTDEDGNGNGSGSSSSNIGTPVAPSVAEFWERWEVRLSELCANVDECPGATRLVQTLARHNVPLAIATSSRAVAVEKKRIRHDGIFKHIPIIVCGDDPAVKNGKPAPDGFLEAARRLGVDPGDCLVFEDAVAGVQSARAAGCRVIAVPDPRMEEDAFVEAKADEVIRSMNDFDYDKWLGLEC